MAYTEKKDKGYYLATLAGICSILLWASTIAFSKSAMDKEGNFNLAFYNFFPVFRTFLQHPLEAL